MKAKLLYVPRLYTGKVNLLRGINIGHSYDHPHVPPLGISILTSYLNRMGFKVVQDDLDIKVFKDNKKSKKRVNMEVFEDKKRILKFLKKLDDEKLEEEGEKILKKTKYKGFDFFGLSIVDDMSFSAVASAIVLAKLLKERTGSYVCIGGVLTSRPFPEIKLIKFDFIDFVVIGNHFAATDLLMSLEEEKIPSSGLEDVIYKKRTLDGFKIVEKELLAKNWVEERKIEEIRPMPDFSGLPIDLYKYKVEENRFGPTKKILVLPYAFGFGCINGCAFCPNSYKPMYKYKNPETVVEELKFLKKKYKTNFFLFLNDNFNPTYEYATKLAKSFIEEGLNIYWLDCVNLRFCDQKLIEILREAGAVEFVIGVESGSQKVLDYVNKGIEISKIKKLIEFSYSKGIWNIVDLIAGLPYETQEDIEATLKFVNEISRYVGWFQVSRFMLMRSKFTKYPQKYGLTNIRCNVKTIFDRKIIPMKFDETYGLKWKEKRKQINFSYRKVLNFVRKVGTYPIKSQVIFYLNDVLGKDELIPEIAKLMYKELKEVVVS